jgi:mono/diheme cytochrome c family protein
MALFQASNVVAAVAVLAVAGLANAGDKADASAGQRIYDRDCSNCHGAQGKGDGETATYLTPQPQDFTTGILKKRNNEFLTTVIAKGGTAKGLSDSMPAFPKLSSADLQNVVAYIRQLGDGTAGQKAK